MHRCLRNHGFTDIRLVERYVGTVSTIPGISLFSTAILNARIFLLISGLISLPNSTHTALSPATRYLTSLIYTSCQINEAPACLFCFSSKNLKTAPDPTSQLQGNARQTCCHKPAICVLIQPVRRAPVRLIVFYYFTTFFAFPITKKIFAILCHIPFNYFMK